MNSPASRPERRIEGIVVRARQVAEEAAGRGSLADDAWRRALFARFLAENDLPAALAGTPAAIPPSARRRLDELAGELPTEVFTAADGLGWCHQLWQAKRKREVNRSGGKIGADELPAMTQLFSEDYMVSFLLDNTLGAWWAAKRLAGQTGTASEVHWRRLAALPNRPFPYLRFLPSLTSPACGRGVGGEGSFSSLPCGTGAGSEGSQPAHLPCPAAGTFREWPDRAADLRILDPCCGSGHFLVAALDLMARLRMVEEGLPPREACDAVLEENLFALEIDRRCAEIAALALAAAAWRFPGGGGFRKLPPMNIACSGTTPRATEQQWRALACGDADREHAFGRLWTHFRDAATLGSLIDPAVVATDAGHECCDGQLDSLLAQIAALEDGPGPEPLVDGLAVQGLARAGAMLADRYHLVLTNVPYLKRGRQSDTLKRFSARAFPDAKADLASTFVERSLAACRPGGVAALVTTQYWLLLGSYRKLRRRLLDACRWQMVLRLGTRAFERIPGEVVNVALTLIANAPAADGHAIAAADLSHAAGPRAKADGLRCGPLAMVPQAEQLRNPDSRVTLGRSTAAGLLREHATVATGLQTGDNPRYQRRFWELPRIDGSWQLQQRSAARSTPFGGREQIVLWQDGRGDLAAEPQSVLRSLTIRGRRGVAVTRMSSLAATLYTGELIDQNAAVIVPHDETLLPAIWAYCRSADFRREVRRLDQKFNITPATLGKVPFDPERWRQAAAAELPGGLPEPSSDDPTQWVFHGRPERSHDPLQVAVARLVGYRWPAELDPAMRLTGETRRLAASCETLMPLADDDGLVPLAPTGEARSAADRLRDLLAAAYGPRWSPAVEADLLAAAGFTGKTLDVWLRDGFFGRHCRLFAQRPFVWHVWDGRREDGFHVLVNYHKLDRPLLERLIDHLLDEWIERSRSDEARRRRGACDRRAAAERLRDRLRRVLAGEPPCDLFIRWKPPERQPLGWQPDLDDGVRLNIRPWMLAGLLRTKPRIRWNKDRRKSPPGSPWYHLFAGDRINDHHARPAPP